MRVACTSCFTFMDDDQFAATSTRAYPWLWKGQGVPSSVEYRTLVDMTRKMYDDDKIWVTDTVQRLEKERMAAMTSDQRVKYGETHGLGQELDGLHLQGALMTWLREKMRTVTHDELEQWKQ